MDSWHKIYISPKSSNCWIHVTSQREFSNLINQTVFYVLVVVILNLKGIIDCLLFAFYHRESCWKRTWILCIFYLYCRTLTQTRPIGCFTFTKRLYSFRIYIICWSMNTAFFCLKHWLNIGSTSFHLLLHWNQHLQIKLHKISL